MFYDFLNLTLKKKMHCLQGLFSLCQIVSCLRKILLWMVVMILHRPEVVRNKNKKFKWDFFFISVFNEIVMTKGRLWQEMTISLPTVPPRFRTNGCPFFNPKGQMWPHVFTQFLIMSLHRPWIVKTVKLVSGRRTQEQGIYRRRRF